MNRPPILDNETISNEKFLNSLAENYLLQDSILASTELSIISISKEGIISSFNPAAELLLGYKAEELIGKENMLLFHHWEEIMAHSKEVQNEFGIPIEPGFESLILNARVKKSGERREWMYKRKDQSSFPVILSLTSIWNEQEELQGYLAIAADITESRKKDQLLRQSESHLHALLNSIDDIAMEVSREGIYKNVWTKNDHLLFIEREAFIGKNIQQVLGKAAPHTLQPYEIAINKVFKTRQPEYLEYEVDGPRPWRSAKISYIDEESVLILIRDITLQKLAEDENKNIFQNSIALLVVAELDGKFRKINPALAQILGWEEEELMGKNAFDFIHPESIAKTKESISAQMKGNQSSDHETRFRCKDGSYRWLLWSSHIDMSRKLLYCTAVDITERKKTEEALLLSKTNLEVASQEMLEQNRQLNEFAHIISHNLRSPVGNIGALISLLDDKSTIEDYKEIFDRLKSTSASMKDTLNDLMETLKIKKVNTQDRVVLKFKPTLKRIIEDMAGELMQCGGEITFDFTASSEISYNKTYLESILLNILSNAIKYRSPERPLKVHFETIVIAEAVILRVIDNGLGIDMKQHGEDLFGLRKTFHEHKDAKGVGLFLTKTQIETMGGKIWMESEVGKGTTVLIQF